MKVENRRRYNRERASLNLDIVQLPSEVFQVAFEDLLQTSQHLPATANALETDQFSDISPKLGGIFVSCFSILFGFFEIALNPRRVKKENNVLRSNTFFLTNSREGC